VRATRLAMSALLVMVALGGFTPAPAIAAGQPKPAEDTWSGRIQRDGAHEDYVGRACPESAQVCYDIVATYRIVPLNPVAAREVRRLSGSQARLHGHFEPGNDGHHTGTLFVRRAEPRAPAPPG
jgi:hypothetical protein